MLHLHFCFVTQPPHRFLRTTEAESRPDVIFTSGSKSFAHASDPVQNVKIKHTVVEVVALRTAAHTHVGALTQMVTSPARRALVAAAADAGLACGRALLATFLIIAEKAAGALRHAGPGKGGNERESNEGH